MFSLLFLLCPSRWSISSLACLSLSSPARNSLNSLAFRKCKKLNSRCFSALALSWSSLMIWAALRSISHGKAKRGSALMDSVSGGEGLCTCPRVNSWSLHFKALWFYRGCSNLIESRERIHLNVGHFSSEFPNTSTLSASNCWFLTLNEYVKKLRCFVETPTAIFSSSPLSLLLLVAIFQLRHGWWFQLLTFLGNLQSLNFFFVAKSSTKARGIGR